MELNYYAADFSTGNLYSRELPLEDVQLRSGIDDPGAFSATLDMRRMVDHERDWKSAREVLDMIRPGTTSIIPALEDITNGAGNATVDAAAGEWWITDIQVQHADPVIKISGVEWAGYLQQNVVQKNWSADAVDPIATAIQLVNDACKTGQNVAMGAPSGAKTSPARVPIEIIAGSTSAWEAIQGLRGDDLFELVIDTKLISENGTPTRIERSVLAQAPRLRRVRNDVAVELVTPGTTPAVMTDMHDDDPIEAYCFDMWAFGAGSGADQLTARIDGSRPARMPRISRMISFPDADMPSLLTAQAKRAKLQMTPDARPFEAVARMSLLPGGGPRVGYVFPFFREPSLSMPTSESGNVRVLEWSWSPAKAGEIEMASLTLQRE